MAEDLPELDPALAQRYQALRALLSELGSAVVALSGGVDSVLLAAVAHDVLGEQALAVTADTPSLPRSELAAAVDLARQIGIRHRVVATAELADPRYAANPADRCYYCKTELFTRVEQLAAELNVQWLLYGENLDDLGDHRPGAVAAAERGVRAPLREAGLGKADIRTLAQHLGLPVWDKPAYACLASRFPYGSAITAEKLRQVEQAEEYLHQLGFNQCRVRHHGDTARIEVLPEAMAEVLARAEALTQAFQRFGFRNTVLDLAGYRRGSLNDGVVAVVSDNLEVI